MLTDLPPLPVPRLSGVVYDGEGENPRRFALDQFDSDQMTAYGQACQASATAEARATIQQLVDALGWLHLGEGPETRVGPALEAGRAWLGEAQKGDGHAL